MLKTKEITIENGRDAGSKFLITEMPIVKADRWANRLLLALVSSGIEVPNINGGMLAIANVAMNAFKHIQEDKLLPLLEELLDCVQIIPEGGNPRALNLDINDIQDLTTLWKLRKEALMLHVDFLKDALTLTSE